MAGVSTKEIKKRIRSMESTKQITKAMEMVAASKLRRAQAQIANSRPYFRILSDTIGRIAASDREFTSPYLQQQTAGISLWIVIGGDRGLAGGYNSNAFQTAMERIPKSNAQVLPIGKRAVEFFRARKIPAFTEAYADAAEVSVGDCFSVAKQLCRGYLAGKIREVNVVYTAFESMLSQTPQVMQLLPLTEMAESSCSSPQEITYDPNPEEVFGIIVPEYLGGALYGVLCESRASEQAARRTAMDNATQNAEDMISSLNLTFNRARQAAITQEITEIVAGS